MHRETYRRLLQTLAVIGSSLFILCVVSVRLRPSASVHAAAQDLHLSKSDLVCRNCHQQIYDRYEKTPMALGSGLAVDGLDANELAAKDLVHRNSAVSYHLSVREGQAYLAFSRPPSPGRDKLEGEHRLDLFVGSARRGRTYLYNQDGLWFEAPINWYGKTQMWDMAPAFDNVQAMPDPLPVDPNCLHCHAGDVRAALGPARNRYVEQPFREGGVGCAACHGDPAAHLARTKTGLHLQEATVDSRSFGPPSAHPDTSIVNPARLDPIRRDDVCLQCHLEGDAVVYRPGKSLQAFKPGEELSASVTYFIDRNRPQFGLRASSQYEALLRSACKRASGDRLTCTTCHDPHGSPSPADRVAFFRARCLSCHTSEVIASKHHPEQQDCAVCHMPTRKTADISHEQLTDHDIEAVPKIAPPALAKNMRAAADLVPVDVALPTDRELGLAYAQIAQRGDRFAGERALTLLQRVEQSGGGDTDVLDQLGFLLQVSGSSKAAAQHYVKALQQSPQDITAAANLAVLEAAAGQQDGAIRLLSKVVEEDPSQTAVGLNLAFLQCHAGRQHDARRIVETMLRYNPDSPAAHRFLNTGRYGTQTCSMQ